MSLPALQNSEAMMQLNQANKVRRKRVVVCGGELTGLRIAACVQLLEVYRLVTSTDIRLIQSTDDDEEADDCTEIVCTTTDSATGNQFEFELAVPAIASSEIEYLPSEKPPTGIKVPSYLRVRWLSGQKSLPWRSSLTDLVVLFVVARRS
jgi:hypothetical protein